MAKVCVLQADNRPSLDYLLKTQKVNKRFCELLDYDYLFLEIDNKKYGDIHPATKKIHIIYDFIENANHDVLVFLDSDAWIHNGYWLKKMIDNLINNKAKHGCFSRDPYVRKNTFINSGSFIVKINDFTKQMYKNIMHVVNSIDTYHNNWPFDQHYISNYIFENKENFVIFIPDTLNTPIGKVLRHNWLKNQQMYDDLNKLIQSKIEDVCADATFYTEADYYDANTFPNTLENGYEYFN